VPTLIFILNSHFCFRKKNNNKGDKSIKITVNNLKQSKITAFTTHRASSGISPTSPWAWAIPSIGQPQKEKNILVDIKKNK
jgi:hypothetical protein